jgi:hypothetical protein
MVESILKRVEGPGSTEKWQNLVQNGFIQDPSFSTRRLFLDEPFRSPDKYNVRRVHEIVETSMRSAEDELELLQTDPEYTDHILQQRLRSEHHRPAGSKGLEWEFMVTAMTQEPLMDFFDWRKFAKLGVLRSPEPSRQQLRRVVSYLSAYQRTLAIRLQHVTVEQRFFE